MYFAGKDPFVQFEIFKYWIGSHKWKSTVTVLKALRLWTHLQNCLSNSLPRGPIYQQPQQPVYQQPATTSVSTTTTTTTTRCINNHNNQCINNHHKPRHYHRHSHHKPQHYHHKPRHYHRHYHHKPQHYHRHYHLDSKIKQYIESFQLKFYSLSF